MGARAAEQRCELVTIVGDAGVGKSRLVAELSAPIEATRRPRPLPPLRGGDHLLAGGRGAEAARRAALPTRPRRPRSARCSARAEAARRAEEIAWAFRKTLEQAARAAARRRLRRHPVGRGDVPRPDRARRAALLGCADPAALHGAAGAQRAPPDLAGDASARAAGRRRRRRADSRSDPRRAAREDRARGGRQPALHRGDAGDGRRERRARSSSRPPCRRCSRRASTSSRRPSGACSSAARSRARSSTAAPCRRSRPTRPRSTPRLAALVRKELIRPDQAAARGRGRLPLPPPPDPRRRLRRAAEGDAGRAAPALRGLAGGARRPSSSSWTRSSATTSSRPAATAPSSGCPHDDELAAAARRRLTAAGRRAALRQDYGAAVSLLERAVALVPPAELDLALETDLVDALFGRARPPSARRADSLAERAAAAGDRVGELCGRIKAGILRLYLEPEGATEQLAALVDRRCRCSRPPATTSPCTSHTPRLGRSRSTRGADGRGAGGVRAGRRPCSAGGRAVRRVRSVWRAGARFDGTTPVTGAARVAGRAGGARRRDHFVRGYRAGALAMLGRFDEARAILAETRAELAERGGGIWLATATARRPSTSSSWPAIPPPPPSSARKGAGCSRSWANRATCRARPGGSRRRSTRSTGSRRPTPGPAARGARRERRPSTQMLWRQAEGKVLARRGEHAEAERLAREAVAIGENRHARCRETVRRPRRGARARGPPDEAPGARAGTRALRAEGEPRHGRADARATGGASAGGACVHDLPQLRPREQRDGEVLRGVRGAARRRAAVPRAAQDRHRPLLRRHRLDRARRVGSTRRRCGPCWPATSSA